MTTGQLADHWLSELSSCRISEFSTGYTLPFTGWDSLLPWQLMWWGEKEETLPQ